jgi:hypothetical protein
MNKIEFTKNASFSLVIKSDNNDKISDNKTKNTTKFDFYFKIQTSLGSSDCFVVRLPEEEVMDFLILNPLNIKNDNSNFLRMIEDWLLLVLLSLPNNKGINNIADFSSSFQGQSELEISEFLRKRLNTPSQNHLSLFKEKSNFIITSIKHTNTGTNTEVELNFSII